MLRRVQFHALLTADEANNALKHVTNLNFESLPPSEALHQSALLWAERLKQSRVNDAQYLALAEALGVEFWTGDKKLANGAAALVIRWVQWVGEA